MLPVELLTHIWSFLTLREYPALANTCTRWAAVIRGFMPRELVRPSCPLALCLLPLPQLTTHTAPPPPPLLPRVRSCTQLLARQAYVDDLFVRFVATGLKPTVLDLSGPPHGAAPPAPVRSWPTLTERRRTIPAPTRRGAPGCSGFSEASLQNVLASCPSLREIRLANLRISSLSTWHLATYGRSIESLDLSGR